MLNIQASDFVDPILDDIHDYLEPVEKYNTYRYVTSPCKGGSRVGFEVVQIPLIIKISKCKIYFYGGFRRENEREEVEGGSEREGVREIHLSRNYSVQVKYHIPNWSCVCALL